MRTLLTARSWATLFTSYGSFTSSRPRRLAAVALHNAAFERRALTAVAEHPSDLVYGVGLSQALAAKRSEMQFVPTAAVDHLNVARWHGVLADSLIGGQLWAGDALPRLGPVQASSPRGRDSSRGARHVGADAALGRMARARRERSAWHGLGDRRVRGGSGRRRARRVRARPGGGGAPYHAPLELHRERYV